MEFVDVLHNYAGYVEVMDKRIILDKWNEEKSWESKARRAKEG